MFSDRIDIKIKINIKVSKMVLKETQTFRVYNPSSVWRKTVFSTLKKGYIPETSVFLSKPFLTLFDIYFYINPIVGIGNVE